MDDQLYHGFSGVLRRAGLSVRETFRDFRDLLTRERSIRLMSALGLLIVLLAILLWLLESNAYIPSDDKSYVHNFWEALYMSFISGTTTGYGDITPHTTLGRIVTVAIIISGMVLTSVLTATIASWFVEKRLLEGKGMEKITWRNHFVICGWNSSVRSLLEGIYHNTQDGAQVVMINNVSEDAISEVLYHYRRQGLRYVRGEFEHENVLERANVQHAKSVVILADGSIHNGYAGADQRTVLGSLAVKSMSSSVSVCAEIVDKANVSHLKRAHVDHIVVLGEHNDFLLSNSVTSPGVTIAAQELLNPFRGSVIRQTRLPAGLVDQEFSAVSAYFREKKGALAIGVVSEEAKGMNLSDILSDDMSAIDLFIKRQFEGMEEQYFFKGKAIKVRLNPPNNYRAQRNDAVLIISSSEEVIGSGAVQGDDEDE